MQLAVNVSGSGPRTAVLVHGIMSDSRAWTRVTEELVGHGFRVYAVDLAGHGGSPRARRYSPKAWADDVVETLAPILRRPPDVVMGHSLGALVASMVVDRLAPASAIYIDPAFAFPRGIRGMLLKLAFALMPRPRRSVLLRMNPRWDAAEVDRELAALRRWDKRTIFGLARSRALVPPDRLTAPSLVVLAERSLLITKDVALRLAGLGMTVETVPDTGHNVHRDDPATFMQHVRGWLERQASAPIDAR